MSFAEEEELEDGAATTIRAEAELVGGSCSITSSSAEMSSSIARSNFGRFDPGGLVGSCGENQVPLRPTNRSQTGGDFKASTSLFVNPTWRPPIQTVGLRGLREEKLSSVEEGLLWSAEEEEEEEEGGGERGRMRNSIRLSRSVAA